MEKRSKNSLRLDIREFKKVIKEKCIDCSAESVTEVRLCPIKDCSLHPCRPFK